MKIHGIAVLALSMFGAFAIGCSAEHELDAESDEEVASTSDALINDRRGAASAGYTCTDAGACQCKGLTDCNDMFGVCKSNLYCNYDEQGGFRCICWNFVSKVGRVTSQTDATFAAAP